MEKLLVVATRPIDRRTALLCLAILGLNLLDAFATLRHLEYGAQEVNPLMQALLHLGARHFLLVKHALVSIGVFVIALYPARRMAELVIQIVLPLYGALGIYHIALFYLM
jgi:hypothetical protein